MQDFHDLSATLPTDDFHKQEYLRGSKEFKSAQNKAYALSKKKDAMAKVLPEGDAMLMHSKWGNVPVAKVEAYVFWRKCWDVSQISKNALQVKQENKPQVAKFKKRRVEAKDIEDAGFQKRSAEVAMDIEDTENEAKGCAICCSSLTNVFSVAPPCCGIPLICGDCEVNFFAQKRAQVRCTNCCTMVQLVRSSWKGVTVV
jgi:hypothetical protein